MNARLTSRQVAGLYEVPVELVDKLAERNRHTGDPTNKVVIQVAMYMSGDDLTAWLSMSQATREEWYQKAEIVIGMVCRWRESK